VTFTHPEWLACTIAACLALPWMWRRHDLRQRAALARFVAPHLRESLTWSLSVTSRRLQRGLYLGSLAFLGIALAGPLVGYRWEQVTRRGIELVFAIDTSRSMLTPDVLPNRLTRAKLAIEDFLNRLDGDAVGLVAFAGTSFLVCPITLDYGAFQESLATVDVNTIPRGGTNIESAIHEAEDALRRRPGSDKIVILVTDGEELEGGALAAARVAAREGVKIFTVGVGTAGGDLIPLPPDQGGGFVKDDAGVPVKSRLDEAGLKAIADATGGIYVPLGSTGEGLDTVFNILYGTVAKHDLSFRQRKVYIERYQWPLAASVACLLVSLVIGTRRWSTRGWRLARRAQATSAAKAMGWALLAVLTPPVTARAAGATPDDTGTTAYRGGAFPQAAQAFQQSITRAPAEGPTRLAAQEDAYYNLGNALYRVGQKTENTDMKATLAQWTQAVKAYETALQLRPDDADSKFNRDFVKRKIDALRQNQNNDKNKNNNQGGGGGGNQGGGGGGAQGGGGGGPQGGPPGHGTPPPGGGSPSTTGSPPPPGGGAPPGSGSPQPPSGAPPAAPPPASQQRGDPPPGDARPGDERSAPGDMSHEEARELLDSAKGDERHALGAPLTRRNANDPPDKPFKNW
jgi:Ca-activated chloride channel family protein